MPPDKGGIFLRHRSETYGPDRSTFCQGKPSLDHSVDHPDDSDEQTDPANENHGEDGAYHAPNKGPPESTQDPVEMRGVYRACSIPSLHIGQNDGRKRAKSTRDEANGIQAIDD